MKRTLILLTGLLACAGFGADAQEDQARAQVQILPAIKVREAVRLNAVATSVVATNRPPSASTPVGDLLELANGDRLRGKFLGLDPDKGLLWQHDSVRDPLSIIPDRTRSLRLQRQSTKPPQAPGCRLQLKNGDRLAGNLVSVDDKEARLETWYGGTLVIPRPALSALNITKQHGDVIYQGPTGLDGWKISTGNRAVFVDGDMIMQGAAGNVRDGGTEAWTFKDDTFQSTGQGTLGRELKLPPLSNIEFDLEVINYPQFAVHFYTDTVDRMSGNNALVVQFSSRTAYLRRNSNSGASRTMGNVESPLGMGAKTKGRVSIRTDLAQQTVALLVDDILLRKYTGIGKMDDLGANLMFYAYGSYPVKISNVVISHWDGRLDDPATPAATLKEDLMILSNKDKISGQLMGIKTNQISFNSAFSKLDVPLDRINSINFADADAAPKTDPQTVRLNFFDGGRITLKVARWDEQNITGESPIYGALKLDVKAFNSAQFGP